MTFDEWLAMQPKGDPTKPITPRMAWDAATRAEREACAAIADTRAMRCEEKTVLAEDADEVTELRSLAWQFSVLAAEMRKRSNGRAHLRE